MTSAGIPRAARPRLAGCCCWACVGVPVALVVLGGNPLPTSITWAELREALLHAGRRHHPARPGHDRRLARLAGVRALGDQRAGRARSRGSGSGSGFPVWPVPSGWPPVCCCRWSPWWPRHPSSRQPPTAPAPPRPDPSGRAQRRATATSGRRADGRAGRARPGATDGHVHMVASRATTCGVWPSASTAQGRIGGGSRRPTPTSSPAGPTGCRSAGGWSFPGRRRSPRPEQRTVTVRRGDTLSVDRRA